MSDTVKVSMKNTSGARYTKHLLDLIGKGWAVNTTHRNSVVSDDFAQFFTYWPHNDHITMACMSIERFIQLKQDVWLKLPADLQSSTSLAGYVCQLGGKTFKPNLQAEEELGIALALYMSSTNTAKMYEKQTPNQPFGFLAVMYPTNEEFTDFAVRPSIYAPLNALMSPQDTIGFSQEVMSHDKACGKTEYFKYLKK